MLSVSVVRENGADRRAVELIPAEALFQLGNRNSMKVLPGRDRQHTPLQNHLEALLMSLFRSEFPSEDAFHIAFDTFEILVAMRYAVPLIEKGEEYWTLAGSYVWRSENRKRIFAEIRTSLLGLGEKSPYVISGIAGKTVQHALTNLALLEEFVPKLRFY